MDKSDLFHKLLTLRRAPGAGARAGMRAPHKPLLLLILLSRIEKGESNRFLFADIGAEFDRLWEGFGWNTQSAAKYPFKHLAGDGFWLHYRSFSPDELSHGALTPDAWALLGDAAIRHEAGDLLLATYFPLAQQMDLRIALGLPSVEQPAWGVEVETKAARIGRDPQQQAKFREAVLLAYEERCAVCCFGPRNARAPSGVEAAHIWPVEYGGPFSLENGLALCPIHHWALDSGTMAFTDAAAILVSARVIDGESLATYVRAFAGRTLQAPLRSFARPAAEFMRRQREKRFLEPAI